MARQHLLTAGCRGQECSGSYSRWSVGWCEGDAVPEVFKFAYVLACLAGAVDMPVVPVRSEVGVPGLGIVDQHPGDLQDVAGDGDDRFLRRGAFGDAPVAGDRKSVV